MYKKTLLSLAVASSLALTGCFESGTNSSSAGAGSASKESELENNTFPVFNPVTGQIPIPNDLIFSDAGDGSFSVGDPDSENPVINALNNLSGGSTVAPYDVAFNRPIDGESLEGPNADGSPNPNQNVFLLELDYDAASPLVALQQGQAPTGIDSINDFTVSRIALRNEQGNEVDHLRIDPTSPLEPNKRYVVVVTDEIQDRQGESISRSPEYNAMSDGTVSETSAVKGVKDLIGLWEGVAQNVFEAREAGGLPELTTENIALSYSFTTSNDKTVLTSIASPAAWLQGQANAQGFGDELDEAGGAQAVASSFDFPTPEAQSLGDFSDPTPATAVSAVLDNFGGQSVWVHQGSINLPYYLGVPDDEDGSPIRNKSWMPDNELATNIQDDIRELTGDEDFSLPWAGDDPDSTVLNANFPFPKAMNDGDGIDVPLLVMTPQDITPAQLVSGLQDPDDETSDELSFKTVIFQHGITTDRSAALGFGTQLINSFSATDSDHDGVVVFAIDQPLHGVEPTPATSGNEEDDPTSSITGWGLILLDGLDESIDEIADEEGDDWVRGTLPNPDGDFISLLVNAALQEEGDDRDAAIEALAEAIDDELETQLDGDALNEARALGIPTKSALFVGTAARSGSTIAGLSPQSKGQGINVGGVTERHFGYGTDAANNIIPMNFDPTEVAGESGDLFINLTNFLNGRDNLRQGSVDLMNLRATIAGFEGVDQEEVYFTGHSLGTVNGSAFVAASLTSQRPDLFVKGTHLLTPASGVVRLLENSPAFAPTILGGLQEAAGIEQGIANFETFLRVFQHTIDSTDPINFADELAVSRTLIGQVNDDQTTPNAADPRWNQDGFEYDPLQIGNFQGAFPAPLSGSEPLAAVMGADDLAGYGSGGFFDASNDLPLIRRYTDDASHSTPVLPQGDAQEQVFGEMVIRNIELMDEDVTPLLQ